MTDTTAGGVTIQLGDEEIVLKPTLRALEKLDQTYGGLLRVMESLTLFRLPAFVDVVAAGTGATAAQREQLPDAIFKAGMAELLPKLTRYMNRLGNGGRPAKDEEKSAGSD